MSLHRRRLVATLAFAFAATPAAAQERRPLLFFAASSLQTALSVIADQWRGETGKRVVFSFAASSALARQLENGAPADLFASADLEWMDWAQRRGLIRADTRRGLLGNTLVLITQRETASNLRIRAGFPLAAALGDTPLAACNPEVPAGRYARAALTSLGVWDQVARRVAGAENVRAALMLVARGEARFGIVFGSDARADPRVRIVDLFPANTHPPIVYPFAATAVSTNPDARAFLEHLSSLAAARVFREQGFSLLA